MTPAGVEELQQRERDEAGDAWINLGLMFTEPDGSPLHPADVTDLFNALVEEADCRRSACTTCDTVLWPSLSHPART